MNNYLFNVQILRKLITQEQLSSWIDSLNFLLDTDSETLFSYIFDETGHVSKASFTHESYLINLFIEKENMKNILHVSFLFFDELPEKNIHFLLNWFKPANSLNYMVIDRKNEMNEILLQSTFPKYCHSYADDSKINCKIFCG